jgi:hypothetical protein
MTENIVPDEDEATSRWAEGTPLVHVIAQRVWHDPAFIAGNRAGIEALRDACNTALSYGVNVSSDARVFASDGEGYRVIVRVLDAAGMDDMPYGYVDPMAQLNTPFWPSWMLDL